MLVTLFYVLNQKIRFYLSKENLKTGDNLISIDQINNKGLVLRHKQLFITKIDEHKKDQPLVISVPNKNGENISIIQQPSEKQKIYKVENNLGIQKKIKSNKKIFNVILCLFHSMDLVYYQMKTRSKI